MSVTAFRRLTAVFLLALCLPALLLSCFVIHCNIRRMVEGTVSFELAYDRAGGFPVPAGGTALPARWEALAVLGDAPTRLILWLYGRVADLAAANE